MQKRISSLPFYDTPEQARKLAAVLEDLKGQAGSVMPALHQAQDIYGYLPMEVQKKIAASLSNPPRFGPRTISRLCGLRRCTIRTRPCPCAEAMIIPWFRNVTRSFLLTAPAATRLTKFCTPRMSSAANELQEKIPAPSGAGIFAAAGRKSRY